MKIGDALLLIAIGAFGVVFAWRWWWPANEAFHTSMIGKPLDPRTFRYKAVWIGRWWVMVFGTCMIVFAGAGLLAPSAKG